MFTGKNPRTQPVNTPPKSNHSESQGILFDTHTHRCSEFLYWVYFKADCIKRPKTMQALSFIAQEGHPKAPKPFPLDVGILWAVPP